MCFIRSGSEAPVANSGLTDAFYAIGGGASAHQIKGDIAFEGGPGIRHGMLLHARRHNMLPC